jgi:hypothetical protein
MQGTTALRELAHRAGDGVEVSLYWSPRDGGFTVVVEDAKTEERFELPAQPDNALEVFYHPYAFAPLGCGTTALAA